MTHKIQKSTLVPRHIRYEDALASFKGIVEFFVKELQDWHDHNVIARSQDDIPPSPRPAWENYDKAENPKAEFTADLKRWEKIEAERYTPYPRPAANPEIEAAIATRIADDGSIRYEPDFELIDDDPEWPGDDEVLETYKEELLRQAALIENEAITRTLPSQGKRRLHDMRYSAITLADTQRTSEMLKGVPPEEIAEAVAMIDHNELRPREDTEFLMAHRARTEKVHQIQATVAQAMSDIEDLTLDTVQKFQLPTFD